jgi:hypothetical protein
VHPLLENQFLDQIGAEHFTEDAALGEALLGGAEAAIERRGDGLECRCLIQRGSAGSSIPPGNLSWPVPVKLSAPALEA